jgi:hypothetical protein
MKVSCFYLTFVASSVPKKVLQENVAIKLGGGKLDLLRVA